MTIRRVLFCVTLFLMSDFTIPIFAQGKPVSLWKTDPDPFTDEIRILLNGEGKKGELELTIACKDGENSLTFGLRFTDGNSKAVFPHLALRFDEDPIERYSVLPAGSVVIVGMTREEAKFISNGDGDGLSWTLAIRDRL